MKKEYSIGNNVECVEVGNGVLICNTVYSSIQIKENERSIDFLWNFSLSVDMWTFQEKNKSTDNVVWTAPLLYGFGLPFTSLHISEDERA